MSDVNNPSSGLLIGVVRNLKTSQSIDQKDIVKQQLENEFKNSGQKLDKQLTEHKENVLTSLGAFREVAKDVRACRERIKSVQNSLQISHTLLQSRREELKKLWTENLEQKKICEILQQIHDIKNLDRVVDGLMKEQKFTEAVKKLKDAQILLDGPLFIIEGLAQLKIKIVDLRQDILQTITENMLQWLIVEAFDKQMLEIARTLNEKQASESTVCMRLLDKYAPGKSVSSALSSINVILANDKTSQLHENIVKAVSALTVFDQLDTALNQLNVRSPSLCKSAVNDTVVLLSLATESNTSSDIQPLHQLIQILIHQIRNSFSGHKMLADELRRCHQSEELHDQVIENFWDCMQDVLEAVVSDHIDIHANKDDEKNAENEKSRVKQLFQFANTASIAGGTIVKTHQPLALICQPDPYNIIKIFYILNRFCSEIEGHTGKTYSKLDNFLTTFVMETFIKIVKEDMDRKIDQALLGVDVWTSLSNVHGHNMKILTSCMRVFELCEQIGNLIKNMESYTQRFASLWVLIMEEYTKSATQMYQRITHTRAVQGENMVEHSKISATWAVDEDISRLLKSLPSWTVIVNQTPAAELTPTGLLNLNESEQEIRQRTQRESEILISNLGVQKEIDRFSVITSSDHIRAIVCMHESLQWFCADMRTMIANIPRKAKEKMKCVVLITSPNGDSVEQVLNAALESRLKSLEAMSETCLLMMHLELRVHCFYHLLPLSRSRPIVIQDDSDPEVVEFGRDLRQMHQLLAGHIAANKVKYLFDGLGHLCASIFINSSQHMTKLPESAQKRLCRNIFTVQRHLSQISGRPEAELNRALFFYELVNKDPDDLLALIMERGASFTYMEYTYLLSLAIRTNTVLSSQRGVLDAKLKQLQEILSKTRR